jgi:hypothetical protein
LVGTKASSGAEKLHNNGLLKKLWRRRAAT